MDKLKREKIENVRRTPTEIINRASECAAVSINKSGSVSVVVCLPSIAEQSKTSSHTRYLHEETPTAEMRNGYIFSQRDAWFVDIQREKERESF